MSALSLIWRKWFHTVVSIGERVSYRLAGQGGPNSRERVRETVIVVLRKD